MNKIDIKSLMIGILFTIIIFLAIGATSQNNNMGNITVTSVNVVDENDNVVGLLTGNKGEGALILKNRKNESAIYLICYEEGGNLITNNMLGKLTISLGTDDNGYGKMKIGNKEGEPLAYIGGNDLDRGDGILAINNRWGNLVCTLGSSGDMGNGVLRTFSSNGKLSTYIGTMVGGGGALNVFDSNENPIVYLGDSKFNSGMLEIGNIKTKTRSQLNDEKLYFTNKYDNKIMILGNIDEHGFIGMTDESGKPIWGKSN